MGRDNRQNIVDGLKGARQKCCGYMGDFCDCKYGVRESEKPINPLFDHSEQTGCPELRTAIMILSEMTDEEYEAIYKRRIEKACKELEANPSAVSLMQG